MYVYTLSIHLLMVTLADSIIWLLRLVQGMETPYCILTGQLRKAQGSLSLLSQICDYMHVPSRHFLFLKCEFSWSNSGHPCKHCTDWLIEPSFQSYLTYWDFYFQLSHLLFFFSPFRIFLLIFFPLSDWVCWPSLQWTLLHLFLLIFFEVIIFKMRLLDFLAFQAFKYL